MSKKNKPVLRIRISRVTPEGGCKAEVISVPQEIQVVFEGEPADKKAEIKYLGHSGSFGERFDVTPDGDGKIEVTWGDKKLGVANPRFPPGVGSHAPGGSGTDQH